MFAAASARLKKAADDAANDTRTPAGWLSELELLRRAYYSALDQRDAAEKQRWLGVMESKAERMARLARENSASLLYGSSDKRQSDEENDKEKEKEAPRKLRVRRKRRPSL